MSRPDKQGLAAEQDYTIRGKVAKVGSADQNDPGFTRVTIVLTDYFEDYTARTLDQLKEGMPVTVLVKIKDVKK